MAAHRGGILTILIPKENTKDIREIPKKVRAEMRIIPVEHMDEVLRQALVLENPDTFFRHPEGQPPLGSPTSVASPVESPAPAGQPIS
jgi:ATP-dependent Lon protease